MSEALAHRLKTLCRISYLLCAAGAVWLYWSADRARSPENLPLGLYTYLWFLVLLVGWASFTFLLGIYLSIFLGVDVFGLNGLLRIPTGKPFHGLRPGEEGILQFDYTAGSIGWSGFNGVFKLRLTNQRLLAGANLTSWHLLEIPLQEITSAELHRRRWLFLDLGPVLRLTRVGPLGTEQWDLRLAKQPQFKSLVNALKALRVPIQDWT